MVTSLSSIVAALRDSNNRFSTIKDLSFENSDIEQNIIHCDRYSVEFGVLYRQNPTILKIFFDDNNSYTINVKESEQMCNENNFPFASYSQLFCNELLVLGAESRASLVDVMLITDLGMEISYMVKGGMNEECYKNLIYRLWQSTRVMCLGALTPDRMTASNIFYNFQNKKISLSPCDNINIHTNSSIKHRTALLHYMTRFIFELLLDMISEEMSEENMLFNKIPDIYSERFDIANCDYFNSENYIEEIAQLALKLEELIGVDLSIDQQNKKEWVRGMDKLIYNLSDIKYCDPNISQYFNNELYTIVGEYFEDRLGIKEHSSQKNGYVNFSGELIIDFIYDEITDFREGYAVCCLNGLYGAIDRFGKIVLPFEYAFLEWCSDSNMFIYEDKNGNYHNITRVSLKKLE